MQQVSIERRHKEVEIPFPDRRKQDRSQSLQGSTDDGNEAPKPDLTARQNGQSSYSGIAPSQKQLQNSSQARQHERETFKIPVCLKIDKKEISGYTHDISPAGLLIFNDIVLESGTPMNLKFSFGDICYLNVSGQVVYCLPTENGTLGKYAIGITFSAIREWERKILATAVRELKNGSSTEEKSLLLIHISKDLIALEAKDFYIQSPKTFGEQYISKRQSCMHASKIIGWGSYLPPQEITNQDINNMVNLNGHKMRFGDVVGNLTGIKSRRFASSHVYPSDLAVEASMQALKNAGVDPKDIEIIISCGVARDVEEPATAYIIQEKLGASNAYCFDLANACNGFISAIDVLDSFIASGRCEIGLVAVGDILSQYVNWKPKSKADLHLSSMAYTFGDGGGAAVLSRIKEGDEQGIRARWFLSDGSFWRVAVIPLMNRDKRYFRSNAVNIEDAALKHVPAGVQETMKMLNWDLEDIDLVIPHQVSSEIIENLFYKKLSMPPEKIFWSFPKHGNVGAASMPVALCAALDEGRLKCGDKVLFVGGSGGFGAGIIAMVI